MAVHDFGDFHRRTTCFGWFCKERSLYFSPRTSASSFTGGWPSQLPSDKTPPPLPPLTWSHLPQRPECNVRQSRGCAVLLSVISIHLDGVQYKQGSWSDGHHTRGTNGVAFPLGTKETESAAQVAFCFPVADTELLHLNIRGSCGVLAVPY